MYFIFCSATTPPPPKCESKKDIALVYEVPDLNAAASFKYLRELASSLSATFISNCTKVSVVVTYRDIQYVQHLSCDEKCISLTAEKLDIIEKGLTDAKTE